LTGVETGVYRSIKGKPQEANGHEKIHMEMKKVLWPIELLNRTQIIADVRGQSVSGD